MADKATMSPMRSLFLVFILVVAGLAMTPSIASMTTDAKYMEHTEAKAIDPAVSNDTALTYSARNASAYFTITLNATESNGLTTLTYTTHFKYSADKTITFSSLNKTVAYLATIVYYYVAMSSIGQSLLTLTPLLWVMGLIAVAVIACYIALRKTK